MSKYVSLKTLGLKLVKLDCINYIAWSWYNKKARNELDGACGWLLVSVNWSLVLIRYTDVGYYTVFFISIWPENSFFRKCILSHGQ